MDNPNAKKARSSKSGPKSGTKILASEPYSLTAAEQWRRNRGNALLGFAVVIFLIGSAFLLYSQNKFVPAEFPDSRSFPKLGIDGLQQTSSQGFAATQPSDLSPDDAVRFLVIGAGDDSGQIRIAVYASPETFNDPAMAARKASVSIQQGEAVAWLPISELPERFAVAVFHDVNQNGALDRNRLGIPTERYGFSRSARGLMGPPTFDDAVIDRPPAGETIELSIR